VYELYKRIRLLGEGAFGKAYLVECLEDKYECVVSVRSTWVTKYIDWNSMAKSETIKIIKILPLSPHPNIVKHKDVYQITTASCALSWSMPMEATSRNESRKPRINSLARNRSLTGSFQICLALRHVHDR
jgi:NIMA (never in mitosis gene a)-related kinase